MILTLTLGLMLCAPIVVELMPETTSGKDDFGPNWLLPCQSSNRSLMRESERNFSMQRQRGETG
jgi:hypothetical protein